MYNTHCFYNIHIYFHIKIHILLLCTDYRCTIIITIYHHKKYTCDLNGFNTVYNISVLSYNKIKCSTFFNLRYTTL